MFKTLILLFFTLFLVACETTPMYTEGDIHLSSKCNQSEKECLNELEKICTVNYQGKVINASYLTKKAKTAYVICRNDETLEEQEHQQSTTHKQVTPDEINQDGEKK